MGEYTPGLSRPEDGGLYPLEEEGTYGRVPKKEYQGKWTGPLPYVKRERKPKMYASYAISDKCELHALVLDKYDRRAKQQASCSTETSSRSSRAVSAPPEFQQSFDKKIKPIERRPSLPPFQKNDDRDELDMLSKLKLSREVEEDTSVSLRSLLGEQEAVTRKC